MPRLLRDENQLSDGDWEVLTYLEVILSIYETVLKTLEGDGQMRLRKRGFTGSYGNVWDVILGFELLLSKLEAHKREAVDLPDGDYFKIGVNLAWAKLDKYYNKLDETPIYYAVLALHPAYRWDWFESTWVDRPDWISKAKSMVSDLWLTEYSGLEIETPNQSASESESDTDQLDGSPPRKKPRFFDPFAPNAFRRLSDISSDEVINGDEYEAWINTREKGDRRIRDPRAYWHSKRHEYPRLAQMAFDLLTVQAMSAECERLFSAAGRLLSPLRSQLDIQLVGMILVLRSWHRAGLVKDLDPSILSLAEEQQQEQLAGLADQAVVERLTSWISRAAEP